MAKKLDTKTDWAGYYRGSVYRIAATNRFDVHTERASYWTIMKKVGPAAWQRIVYDDNGNYFATVIGLAFVYENGDRTFESVGLNTNSVRDNLVTKIKRGRVYKYQHTSRQSTSDTTVPNNKVNFSTFHRVKSLPTNIIF